MLGTVASRAPELGRAVDLLPPVERELLRTGPLADKVLADAEVLARELAPTSRSLEKAIPQVNRLLRGGPAIRRESKRLSRLANPVLELARPQLYDLYPTVASLDTLIASLDQTVANIVPYERDITLAGQWMVSATQRAYPPGHTAPNNPVLRFIPVIGCHKARDPFPAPGEALTQAATC